MSDYFISSEYEDIYEFDQKTDTAVFIGSTTGAKITRDVVEQLSLPRLRSAVFFLSSSGVEFRLPNVVQCDTSETADMIRALGVAGATAAWKDQLKHKYILSMDGNGATCSRVAIALHSRSALVKYISPFQLYYFEGLKAGRDFISVERDEDVQALIEAGRVDAFAAREIAGQGRLFARRYLTRLPVMTYVANLLDLYGATVSARQGHRRPTVLIDSYGHLQELGDVWSAPLGGWLGGPDGRLAIEGFALDPVTPIDLDAVQYQGVLADGTLTASCTGRQFCGTRGQGRPLHGARITLVGAAATAYELSYEAAFRDGVVVGPVAAGMVARSATGAELVGLRLVTRQVAAPV